MEISKLPDSSIQTISNSTHVQIAAEVISYIRNQYVNATLKEIAERLHYHPDYLSNLLVRTTGMTFRELLTNRRSIVGRTLIMTTNYSMYEIATMLGFDSYSGFYRAFLRKFHMSPEKFMKVNKENGRGADGFELSLRNK